MANVTNTQLLKILCGRVGGQRKLECFDAGVAAGNLLVRYPSNDCI